jgi:hypothetical protein
VADARATRRANRAQSKAQKGRRDRPVVRGVFWRELALILVCVEIGVFVDRPRVVAECELDAAEAIEAVRVLLSRRLRRDRVVPRERRKQRDRLLLAFGCGGRLPSQGHRRHRFRTTSASRSRAV